MSRLVLFVAAALALCLPSEARSQAYRRAMILKERERQKKEKKQQKEYEAKQRQIQAQIKAEKERLLQEAANKVYDVGLECTLILYAFPDGTHPPRRTIHVDIHLTNDPLPTVKGTSWIEVHGTVLRFTGAGEVDIEVEEGKEKTIRHFKAGDVESIHRMYETEFVWRVPKNQRNSLRNEVIWTINFPEDAPAFGRSEWFAPSIFGTGEATEWKTRNVEIQLVLDKWKALGNEDSLGIPYTWSKQWAQQQFADQYTNKGILERAAAFYSDLTDAERQRANEVVRAGAGIVAEAIDGAKGGSSGDSPSPSKRSDKKTPPKKRTVTLTGKVLYEKTRKPVPTNTKVRIYDQTDIGREAVELIDPTNAWTKADGSFSLKVINPSVITVWVFDKKVWEGKVENDKELTILVK